MMNSHVMESTCVLSAFIKGDGMSGSEKDAGFCSGGDEDDMSGLHSPSASEDSVDVQIMPISLRNKRKLAEPRKIQELLQTAPLKKRRFDNIPNNTTTTSTTIKDNKNDRTDEVRSSSPFRPWSSSSSHEIKNQNHKLSNKTDRTNDHDNKEQRWLEEEARRRKELTQRQNEKRIHEEVLARLEQSEVKRNLVNSNHSIERRGSMSSRPVQPIQSPNSSSRLINTQLQDEPLALIRKDEVPRVPAHPGVDGQLGRSINLSNDQQQNCPGDGNGLPSHDRNNQHYHHHHHDSHQQQQHQHHQNQQRNYKNMTRERRIEANARERTRVHTISAAFDTLRRSIPAYSHNQKLSKLSVLRIACSYIMTLSKIVNTPEGNETTGPALGACVDLVSRTIQTEGKLRKKKDE